MKRFLSILTALVTTFCLTVNAAALPGEALLTCRWQVPLDGEPALRLVACVDGLSYRAVGFVLSLTESEPTIGKKGVKTVEQTTVYPSLYVNHVVAPAKALAADASHLFVFTLTDITEENRQAVLYCRAFVLDPGGTIRYGAVKQIRLSDLFRAEEPPESAESSPLVSRDDEGWSPWITQ